ncbi:helix-turn-helix transcriptional regulator [Candidatus Poribacteria bacterium]|nr:helix-turn-helix transcriptional regulator [Candidatus Poribacteria bacterium]
MTFGERLMTVRKKKKLSQAEVGKEIGISGDAYGRYERGEVRPTIEMAVKIAQAMNVSLDYLTGATDMELDDTMLKRIQAVSKLPTKEKECVYVFLDSFIDRMKLQGAL